MCPWAAGSGYLKGLAGNHSPTVSSVFFDEVKASRPRILDLNKNPQVEDASSLSVVAPSWAHSGSAVKDHLIGGGNHHYFYGIQPRLSSSRGYKYLSFDQFLIAFVSGFEWKKNYIMWNKIFCCKAYSSS